MNKTEYSVSYWTENQTVYNIYRYAETVLQWLSGKFKKGICIQAKGGLSGLSQLRSDGSRDSQMRRLSRVSSGQKQLKGGPSGSSLLKSDGSRGGQAGRLDCRDELAKDTEI